MYRVGSRVTACLQRASTIATPETFPIARVPLHTMANAKQIQIPAANTGLLAAKQTDEAANVVSELLQNDLEKHHVFFNDSGFHNHIPHHLLALYGTGSPSSLLRAAYAGNTSYQKPARAPHARVSAEILPNETWESYLGNSDYYPDFLAFFQGEIDAKGWKAVVSEYLFAGTPRSEDMLQRMFCGFVHPLIQLMGGLEWAQPAIVAQGLAEAAVHKNQLGKFFAATAEEAAKEDVGGDWSVMDIYQAARENRQLRDGIRSGDANKMYDGVLARAFDEAVRLAARVRVEPVQREIDERTAEMYQGVVAMAASSAVVEAKKRGKEARFDFFLMHQINVSPVVVTINRQDWVTLEAKAKLLEWKIRMDLLQYISRGSSPIDAGEVMAYVPREPYSEGTSQDLIIRIQNIDHDDGHAIKMARAFGVCAQLSQPYADKEWATYTKDNEWAKLHSIILESAHPEPGQPQTMWVRTAAFDENWKDVPDKN